MLTVLRLILFLISHSDFQVYWPTANYLYWGVNAIACSFSYLCTAISQFQCFHFWTITERIFKLHLYTFWTVANQVITCVLLITNCWYEIDFLSYQNESDFLQKRKTHTWDLFWFNFRVWLYTGRDTFFKGFGEYH